MKLTSKYFDQIRVKPEEDRLQEKDEPQCEWPGCSNIATNRAPKGRGKEGEYHNYCLVHVREYNKSYNYFSGMDNDDVVDYQKSAMTGHRPTWSMGANPTGSAGPETADSKANPKLDDPFDVLREMGGVPVTPKKPIRNAERKALEALGLDETASPEEAKTQFKLMVKRHHPDANKGAKEKEEKLREIIQAYDYLKTSGFC